MTSRCVIVGALVHHSCELLLATRLSIYPSDCAFLLLVAHTLLGEISEWSDLSIEEGISEQQFFVFKCVSGSLKLLPISSFRSLSTCDQLFFKIRKLSDERGTDFEVRSPGVKKLQGFEQTPSIPPHEVRSDHT